MNKQINNDEVIWCGHCKKEIKGIYITEGRNKYKTRFHIKCFIEMYIDELCDGDIESLKRSEFIEGDFED